MKDVYFSNTEAQKQDMKRKHREEIQSAINNHQCDKVAEFYVAGYNILFAGLYDTSKQVVELPQYQFNKSLCWLL